jgi:hypothetical protein
MPIMRLGWNSLIIKASSNALSLVIYNTFVRRNYDKLLAQIILLLLPFFFPYYHIYGSYDNKETHGIES